MRPEWSSDECRGRCAHLRGGVIAMTQDLDAKCHASGIGRGVFWEEHIAKLLGVGSGTVARV
jgi:hypothetical protein